MKRWTGIAATLASLASGCSGDVQAHMSDFSAPPSVKPGEIVTIVGSGNAETDPIDANRDGKVDDPIPLLIANLKHPIDVTFSREGKLYVVDWDGQKIRSIEGDKLAFVVGSGFEGDGCEVTPTSGTCPAGAEQLNNPTSVAFDAKGRLVIAAWQNSKIKRVDLTTQLAEDWCGAGDRNFKGDGRPCRDASGANQVSFDLPSSVAFDEHDNLFISDQSNQVVRRLSAVTGVVTTVVGNCPGTPGFGCPAGHGYSGDGGPATKAYLGNYINQGAKPQGRIAFDRAGRLYIADTDNSVIRRVIPGADGVLGQGDPNEETIETIAGSGTSGYSGDGGPAREAQLSYPTDVVVSDSGDVYIADRGNNCVRHVAPDGVITTVAGKCGTAGFSGDGALAIDAELSSPYGVELDGNGGLYIADTDNNRIRKVQLGP